MAKKTSLREFQQYLADRLSGAARGQRAASLLGMHAGDGFWLLDLADSGEIVQLPRLAPVPLTRPAFAGIANIRGNLYAVTDFSVFCGGEPTLRNASARLLLVGTRHGSNAALLVSRLLGLKNIKDFTPVPQDASADWVAGSYQDAEGRVWRKLGVRELLADREFMDIGV